MNQKPILNNSYFYHKGVRYDVEFYELLDRKIPDLDFVQVYAVGNLDGKAVVVKYPDARDNLPGGGTEAGETVEQTLRQEIKEELNMRVIDWWPIGVQNSIGKNGDQSYSLRVYAELEKLGEFVKDPGGSVIGYELIDIEDLEKHINYGEVGQYLIERTREFFR